MPITNEALDRTAAILEGIDTSIPLFTEEGLARLNKELPPLREAAREFSIDSLNTVEDFIRDIETTINIDVSNDFSDITKRLDSILNTLSNDATEALEAPGKRITSIVTLGQQQIQTSLTPVLQTLDGIAQGVLSLSALPTAAAISIMTNLNQAMAFLQTSQLSTVNQSLEGILEATVETTRASIDAVNSSSEGLLKGIVDAIDQALGQVSALLLDPIASLLAGIIAALDSLPERIAEAALLALFKDRPELEGII